MFTDVIALYVQENRRSTVQHLQQLIPLTANNSNSKGTGWLIQPVGSLRCTILTLGTTQAPTSVWFYVSPLHHCQVVYLAAKYKEVRLTPRMAETLLWASKSLSPSPGITEHSIRFNIHSIWKQKSQNQPGMNRNAPGSQTDLLNTELREWRARCR